MEIFLRKSLISDFSGLITLCLFVISFSCGQNKSGPAGPQNLQTEYQSNPLGIDSPLPRFTWEVNDQRPDARQSAYQILVATDPGLLNNDEGDIWDSGKIDSDQSVLISYGGSPLTSGQRYYWKVRTWDGEGNASLYSTTAWWEMGLLSPAEWKGDWIGKKIDNQERITNWPWGYWIWHPREIGIHVPVFFRKKFTLPAGKNIRTALVRVTADNYFTLTLNENTIGKGSKWTEVYQFKVLEYLQPGENLIAVKAANSLGDVCGLILSLKISFDDGSEMLINSDSTWKTTEKKISEWKKRDFSDKNWGRVRVIGAYGTSEWGKIDPEDTYSIPPSILVRNEFNLDKKIKQARAYVTGLGSYVLYLNGNRVGNDIFTPGWTDYPTRIQYQTYDVTSMLNTGRNAAGAVLGNMWWSGGLGWKGAASYSSGPLRLLLQLNIDYEDGSTEEIMSSPEWKTTLSPILENHIYHGESYDARNEPAGWASPGFNDSTWSPVLRIDQDNVKLVAQQGPTIRITETLKPQMISEIEKGKYIVDMGQNMVGWAKLRVQGEAGTKVTLRFAEILNKDGTIYTENLRSARATDTYILKGQGIETWQPMFTYHGFRYIEVSGYPGTPDKEAISGQVLHSAPPVTLEFTCSNELINRIQHNIFWGQRGNMHSVPTDCPQRDERLGWMGDAQIFAPTACYNMNMSRFFSKWMHDISDCQDDDGAVHDVNPTIVVTGPAKPGWGDAVVVVPWVVYQYYGDKRIIEENYQAMAAWVGYMQNNSIDYLYDRSGYGDWIAVVESPKEPIGAAYFYYSTKLLAQMAGIIGKTADQNKYNELASHIAGAFQKKYYDPSSGQYQGGTQTANLLPLVFGITPEDQISRVFANIVKDVKERGNHPSTGFLGTAYLLPMLSQYGEHELAYQLASQKEYPSWGYMVEKDATTIWELWNSDTQGPGMNSRNHFALGSVGEWFYAWLAGIRPSIEEPGFKRIVIAPRPAGDLTWAEAKLQSLYGEIHSFWKRTENKLSMQITIPANTSAFVHVPNFEQPWPLIEESGKVLIKAGQEPTPVPGINLVAMTDQATVFEIGAGKYNFTATF
jgi:alpha-L-rhamnosidase